MRTEKVRATLEAERCRLARARDALLHDALAEESQRGAIGELSSLDEHLADVATETFDREVELGLLRTVEAELAEVAAALRRLHEGSYGTCLRCGVAIPDDRLRVVPATGFCLVHQDEAERADAAVRGGGRQRACELEAVANLDLLPSDEPIGTAPPAEEAAMHLVPPVP